VTIPWQGLSWARRPAEPNENGEEQFGPAPQTTADIVQVGDVIRIMPTETGSWRLAQVPKAEAGLVALNPQTGAIMALVGGFDYQQSNFNRITNAERQPGSSFKPFIYSAALEHGYTLASVINDAPLVLENHEDGTLWRPQNDTHRFYGPTRLHTAIIHSRNLVSIRLLDQIGISYAVKYAQKFGFTRQQLPHGLSLALGTANATPLQLASAYSIFANGGFQTVPYIINRILNSRGELIYQAKPLLACPSCVDTSTAATTPPVEAKDKNKDPLKNYAPRVISAQNAFLITSALRDVIQHGTAIQARHLNRTDLAGKTGTTNNQYDAWFAGYNRDLVAVAWVGYDQPQSLYEYGNQAALPLWMNFMQSALKDRPERPIEQPPNIVSVRIDPNTGKRASAKNGNAIFEYFMTPFVPEEESPGTHFSDTVRSETKDIY
jgi:penicillin-binding protein 1A